MYGACYREPEFDLLQSLAQKKNEEVWYTNKSIFMSLISPVPTYGRAAVFFLY